jgi:hypothetical protein
MRFEWMGECTGPSRLRASRSAGAADNLIWEVGICRRNEMGGGRVADPPLQHVLCGTDLMR